MLEIFFMLFNLGFCIEGLSFRFINNETMVIENS